GDGYQSRRARAKCLTKRPTGRIIIAMRKGQVTRERILDTAVRLASKQGLEGLSFGDLASQLHVSKSGLFAHFPTKEDLEVDTLARTGRLAVQEGHFHGDVDCDQFAFDLQSIMLGFNHLRRLLRDPKAERRTRAAFERLIRTAETP